MVESSAVDRRRPSLQQGAPHRSRQFFILPDHRAERAHRGGHERDGEHPVSENSSALFPLHIIGQEVEPAVIGQHLRPFRVIQQCGKLQPDLRRALADLQMGTARGALIDIAQVGCGRIVLEIRSGDQLQRQLFQVFDAGLNLCQILPVVEALPLCHPVGDESTPVRS